MRGRGRGGFDTRDEGSLSGFGTKLLCVLNRNGWASDLNGGFGGLGRSVGYGVLGVARRDRLI